MTDIPDLSLLNILNKTEEHKIEVEISNKNKDRENKAELALLVSCIGRKLVMNKRVSEETEYVKESLDEGTLITGFYSDGQIAPFNGNDYTSLHNQTMTVTLISE